MFTVVSDPPEDEGDCVDVAYASVDFVQVGSLCVVARPNDNQSVYNLELNLSLPIWQKL